MNVLVLGSGGREHALAWKLAQSTRVDRVYCAPGNAGTALEARVENVSLGLDDFTALSDFAVEHQVGLTVVGPEAPLVEGIVDHFQALGLRCFGPGRGAAQLEGSKAFTKAFLQRHDIASAAYAEFTDLDQAIAYLRDQPMPIVVKADGLAAGKGVVIAQTVEDAIGAATNMLTGGAFGAAGSKIVVEEFLQGEEASFIVVVDGTTALPLASSQDHKARDDGDLGPNTGGMGAYSPAPVVDAPLHARIMREVIEPTVAGLNAEGLPFIGFLYAGLMIDEHGAVKVLEYNCRAGDPETQPIMLRMRTDLLDVFEAALDGRLSELTMDWDPRVALGVVLAAGGYPESYQQGDVISGLGDEFPDTKVFHAGTRYEAGNVLTAGGRVLCACGLGATVADAQAATYARVSEISWREMYYRRDIGYRAVAREQTANADSQPMED
ncbi:MAG: phosphoribosylamine--glycine ligase [Gammaproteobacteria bacterium]|jgi:phosphoribosylamine--glycine ligase